ADLDGDGDLDLVAAEKSTNSVLWYGQERGEQPESKFFARTRIMTEFDGVAHAIAADVTGDGLPDVIAAGWGEDKRILLAANRGQGLFAAPQQIGTRIGDRVLLNADDCDNDGRLDILVASSKQIDWYRNAGESAFAPALRIDTLRDATWARRPDAAAVVLDAETGDRLDSFPANSAEACQTALSPTGNHLAIAEFDNRLIIWNRHDKTISHSMSCEHRLSDLAYTPDGRFLLAACGDRLYGWETDQYTKTFSFAGHENSIVSINVSSDCRCVATCSDDRSVRVWSIPEGTLLCTLLGHATTPLRTCFTPDAREIASVERSYAVHIWDLVTGQELLTLTDASQAAAQSIKTCSVRDCLFSDSATLSVLHDGDEQSVLSEWSIASRQHPKGP
ncbi:MAG: VCBS repeat-containing protein, partial [Planctomycetales bacterium]|nr:VCBS repeat-containing protein [Planctomycetales bacterium]